MFYQNCNKKLSKMRVLIALSFINDIITYHTLSSFKVLGFYVYCENQIFAESRCFMTYLMKYSLQVFHERKLSFLFQCLLSVRRKSSEPQFCSYIGQNIKYKMISKRHKYFIYYSISFLFNFIFGPFYLLLVTNIQLFNATMA